MRKFHELALRRKRVVFMPLHWAIVHPIDESSPLHGMSEQEFAAADAEVLILLTALDETFSQTVHTRSSYKVPRGGLGGQVRGHVPRLARRPRPASTFAKLHLVEKV